MCNISAASFIFAALGLSPSSYKCLLSVVGGLEEPNMHMLKGSTDSKDINFDEGISCCFCSL